MFDFAKTLLNGLECFVRGEVGKLRRRIEAVEKAAAKAGKQIKALRADIEAALNDARSSISSARYTAVAASNAAATAQNTADAAKTAASTAQSTADAAKTAAGNAQSTANAAKTTADDAKTVANSAKTAADTAQATGDVTIKYSASKMVSSLPVRSVTITNEIADFELEYPVDARGLLRASSLPHLIYFKGSRMVMVFGFEDDVISEISINSIRHVGFGRLAAENGYLTNFFFISNDGHLFIRRSNFNDGISAVADAESFALGDSLGGPYKEVPRIELSEFFIPPAIQRVGDDVIIPSSTTDSTKRFKITVDDSGTLSATEVT